MPSNNDSHEEGCADRWEDTLRKFERAWLDQQNPRIEDFVPADAVAARHVLPQLVTADLAFRLKRHDKARVEEYYIRFPQLCDIDILEELLRTECLWRSKFENFDPLAEYSRRFPELRDQIEKWAPAVDNLPPTVFHFQKNGAEGSAAEPQPGNQDQPDGTAPGADHTLNLDVFGAAAEVMQDFALRNMLGYGGMGAVYLAWQHSLQRYVAIKVLADPGLRDAEARSRFQREAVAMARLQHPNIVQVYATGEAAGRLYYIMEYVPGGNLGERIQAEKFSADASALTIEQLAHGLHAAHEHKLIHRDIKPANILLAADGTPKLGDFGLVKRLDHLQDTILPGPLMGTPKYMSPEQASGHTDALSPASDIYSLGAILYELITGELPITGDGLLEVLENLKTREPRRPRDLVPLLSRDLEAICLKCLRKLPAERYATALELAEDLARYRTGQPVLAPQQNAWHSLRRRWSSRAVRLGVVAALAIVAALTVAAYQTPEPASQNAVGANIASANEHAQDIRRVFLEAHNALNASLTKESAAKATLRGKIYYNSFLEQYQNDSRFINECAMARYGLGRIARIEGDEVEALQQWHSALELIPGDGELITNDDLSRLHCYVQINLQLALLQTRRKDYEAGSNILANLRRVLEKHFERTPQNVSVKYALGLCYSRHVSLMGKGLAPQDVLPLCQRACELFQELHETQPPPPFEAVPTPERYRSCLTEALTRRGAVFAELEDHNAARRDFEAALKHAEAGLAAGDIADPNDDATLQKWNDLLRDAQHGLARSSYMIGKKHLNDSHPELADKELELAIRLWSQIIDSKTSTASQRFYFASSYYHLAIGQRRQGQHAAALDNYQTAATLWEALLAEKPSTYFNRQLTESHLAESRAEIAKLTVTLSLNALLKPMNNTQNAPIK